MSASSSSQRPLAAAISTVLFAALMAPGAVLAQTAKEQELEARIAQLEQQIQQLLGQQQQQQTAISQTQTQLDQVRIAQAPAVPAGQQPIQSTTILPGANPGSKFTVGGMVRMDAMVTKTTDGDIGKNTAGRDFYVPGAIPVTAVQQFNAPDPYFDAHAKFSRLWFDASTVLDGGGKLGARVEVDFFGGGMGNGGPGNSAATNTYATTIRHAYLTYNNWLFGQTWSNFMNVGALVDSVDFVGATDAVVFVRQAQVRYTNGPWSFSLEAPETTVIPNLGGSAQQIMGDNSVPDLTIRYTHTGHWGHVSLGGILRQLKTDPSPGFANGSSDTGFGASVSGLFKLGDTTDVRYQITGGEGIGRYIGLATANRDAMTRSDGHIDALGGWAAYLGLRHVIRPGLRGNVYYSTSHWDNNTVWTGTNATKRLESWHANLIWSPAPKLDLGVELMWGERTLESGRDGELTRLQTMARYSF